MDGKGVIIVYEDDMVVSRNSGNKRNHNETFGSGQVHGTRLINKKKTHEYFTK